MRSFKTKYIIRTVCFFAVLLAVFSACNYLMANENTYTRVMMHEMYTDEQPIDMVFSGGSIVYRHFDPDIWDQTLGMHTFNLGSSSQTPDASYYLMKELFKTQKPKYCIYGLTTVAFMNLGEYKNPIKDRILFDYMKPSFNKLQYGIHAFKEDVVYSTLLPFLRNKDKLSFTLVRNNLHIKRGESYKNYGYNIYSSTFEAYHGRGFVYSNNKKENGAVGELTLYLFTANTVDDMKVTYLRKLASLCRANDCELILIAPPIPYASMVLQEDYQVACDFYRQLATENELTLFDFGLAKPELFALQDCYFYDAVHMNGEAAERFSTMASQVIKAYIGGESIDREKLFYSSYQELLDASPTIFNAWITFEDGVYIGNCTHGNHVVPEYQFSYRVAEGDNWTTLRKYDESASITAEAVPNDATELRLCVRPRGSTDVYQQFDIFKIR